MDSIGIIIIIFNTIIMTTILMTAHPCPYSNISEPQTIVLNERDMLLCSRSDGLRLLLCVEGTGFSEVGCGIIGSPRSMDMVCPDNIGRDSWDRGGQEAVVCPDCNSPQEFGGRNPHQVYTRNWRKRNYPRLNVLLLLLWLLLFWRFGMPLGTIFDVFSARWASLGTPGSPVGPFETL